MTEMKGCRKGLLQNMNKQDKQGMRELWQKIFDLKETLERERIEKKSDVKPAPAKGGWLSSAASMLSRAPKDVAKSSEGYDYFTYEQFEEELLKDIHVDHPDNLLIRYLRARKHNANDAFTMIYESIKFFHEHQMYDVRKAGELALVQYPMDVGELYFHGHDKEGNALLYLRAKLHNPKITPLEKFSKFLMYFMSQGYVLLGEKRITGIVDLQGLSLSNVDYPNLKFATNILANNFPECLSRVVIFNAPWIFSGIWNVICTFLDPVVKDKIQFINQEDLVKFADPKQLPASLGGTNKYEYHYIPPTEEQASLKNDPAEYERLKAERKRLGYAFLDATERWLKGEAEEAERDALADQLAENFRELSPYTWSPSIYCRNGFIKNFDDVDFSSSF